MKIFSDTPAITAQCRSKKIIVAGTRNLGHIIRSVNDGDTWSDLGQQFSQTGIWSLCAVDTGIVLAGTGTGGLLLRSTNNGATWSNIGAIASGESYIMALMNMGNGVAVAVTNPSFKVVRSTDKGATWGTPADISADSTPYGIISLGGGIGLIGSSVGNIYRTTDYGANWSPLGTVGGITTAIYKFVYAGNGDVLAIYNAGYVARSRDLGATWYFEGRMTYSLRSGCSIDYRRHILAGQKDATTAVALVSEDLGAVLEIT